MIVGCSAVIAASLVGFIQSASAAEQCPNQSMSADRATILIAQTTNQSNGTGTGVSSSPSGSFSPTSSSSTTSVGSYSPSITSLASSLSSRMSAAQSTYNTAVANLTQVQTLPPVLAAPVPSALPVRYGRQAVQDLASCGCPNTDTVGTVSTTTPAMFTELIAAKAAVASAETELAAARSEAQKFLESIKNENTTRRSDTTLW